MIFNHVIFLVIDWYVPKFLIYLIFVLILTVKDYCCGNVVNRNCYIKRSIVWEYFFILKYVHVEL